MSDSRTRSEYIVAATALVVSLSTLGVYIYQAKVMREQQHISVWPCMEWNITNAGEFHVSAQNKGVGPAIIRKAEMSLDGRPMKNNRELITAVLGPDWTLGFLNSSLEGRVLIPGEEIMPFRIPDPNEAKAFDAKLRGHTLGLRITYCSVYGDCWVTDGDSTKRLPKVDLGFN